MIDMIAPDARDAFAMPLMQMYRDRKRVFVDQLGWQLKAPGSWLELDDYDNEHAVYLMARDAENGDHLGSVRLLATTGAHMMEGVFPHLCMDGVIRSERTWEISRLVAAVHGRGKAGTRLLRVHRMLAIALVEFAMLNDIESFVLVAESQRVPALLSVGWSVLPLGLPVEADGQTIEALQIVIAPDTLEKMRARLGYAEPLLIGATGLAEAA